MNHSECEIKFAGNNIDKASKKGLTDAYLEMAASTADDEDTFVTFHRNDLDLPR